MSKKGRSIPLDPAAGTSGYCNSRRGAVSADAHFPRLGLGFKLGGPPHPVIVTTKDTKGYIRVLLYSSYTTITGWGGGPPQD